MSSTITGLGSGFDINGWVNQLVAVKQQSTLTPLKVKLNGLENKNSALTSLKTKFSTLQTELRSFTNSMYGASSDMWSKTSVTSSNDSYVTASTTGNVAAAKVDLFIEQIATSTTAKSTDSLGVITKDNMANVKFDSLANGQAKTGTFSMFLDGREYKIDIASEDSLKDVVDKINTASEGKIQADVDEKGNFSIKAYKETLNPDGTKSYSEDTDAKLLLGSSGDTSNLASALKLHTKVGTHGYSSAYSISTVDTSATLSSKESGLAGLKFFDENGNEATSGKLIINGAEIEVNKDMSLNDVISKINSNSDAKVKASYDSLTNKVILSSSETGESNISLNEEGTNLLNVLGLTQNVDGNEIIKEGSQELGQNAIVHINGNKIISNSNTITGESSGIANLSINIKKQTSDFSNNDKDEKSVSLTIEQDNSEIKEHMQKFVDAYNDVVSTAKKMTQSDGAIGRDASLNSVISRLKGLTSMVAGGDNEYKMLAQIGIETSSSDITKLTFNEEKLDKALKENPDAVKNLLSDGYVSKDDTGIFDRVIKDIDNILDVEKGYFKTQSESVQSLIKSTNRRMDRANDMLNSYQQRITKQFNQMDATIANLNAQMGSFLSYIH